MPYDDLVKRLRKTSEWSNIKWEDYSDDAQETMKQAADAIEELQATLCNWCAVCPRDKRDLSTCEIYESCRANPPKEE